MKLKRQPGRPSKLSWVHAAVWKVDKSWKPFVGEVSWEDIEKKVNGKNKKVGKKKDKAGKKAKAKAAGAAVAPAHTANAVAPAPETNAELLGPEANDIIAAYTDV